NQELNIQDILVVPDRHRASGTQRIEQLKQRDIKRKRRQAWHHVQLVKAKFFPRGSKHICQAAMFHHHTLWVACRSRRVNHISEVFAMCDTSRIVRGLLVNLIPHIVETNRGRRGVCQLCPGVFAGKQHRHARVRQHVIQSLCRIVRNQGNVSATGLENCEQCNQRLQRALQTHSHSAFQTHSRLFQVMGQLIGAPVQLCICELAVTIGHGRPLRSAFNLLQELFEKQVESTPKRTAVTYGDRQLTYAELNRSANQLAHYLKKSGVSLESRVGVCLERSLESLVALLAIFKAGGAYAPLVPYYPTQRLNYMLTDARVTVLLTSKDTRAKLADTTTATICLDDVRDQIDQQATDNPGRIAHGENLAYVIYTSGSTGNPKGVMVEHRGLANVLAATREKFGFNQLDVMPCLASFSFDISLFELLNPLCAGGTVAIWNHKDVLDVQLLIESLAGFTCLHCVPTLMRQIVSSM